MLQKRFPACHVLGAAVPPPYPPHHSLLHLPEQGLEFLGRPGLTDENLFPARVLWSYRPSSG
jgi:hypothetical protein